MTSPVDLRLLFVYNADSGFFGALADSAHKVLRPDTYSCHLCKLTYGLVGMQAQWREYLASLDLPMDFLHRDEFIREFPDASYDLPAVFLRRSGALEVLLDAATVNAADSLDALQTALSLALTERELDDQG